MMFSPHAQYFTNSQNQRKQMTQTFYVDPQRKSTTRQRNSSKAESIYKSHDYKKRTAMTKESGDTGSDEATEETPMIEINQRPQIRNQS